MVLIHSNRPTTCDSMAVKKKSAIDTATKIRMFLPLCVFVRSAINNAPTARNTNKARNAGLNIVSSLEHPVDKAHNVCRVDLCCWIVFQILLAAFDQLHEVCSVNTGKLILKNYRIFEVKFR